MPSQERPSILNLRKIPTGELYEVLNRDPELVNLHMVGTGQILFKAPLTLTLESILERSKLVHIIDFLSSKSNIASVLNIDDVPQDERREYIAHLEDYATMPGSHRYVFHNPRAYIPHLRQFLVDGMINDETLKVIDGNIASVWGEKTLTGVGLKAGVMDFGPPCIINVDYDRGFVEKHTNGTVEECLSEVVRLVNNGAIAVAKALSKRGDFPDDRMGELLELAEAASDNINRGRLRDTVSYCLHNPPTTGMSDAERRHRHTETKARFREIIDGVGFKIERKVDDMCGGEASFGDKAFTVAGITIIETLSDVAVQVCTPNHPTAETAVRRFTKSILAPLPPEAQAQLGPIIKGTRDRILEELQGTSESVRLLEILKTVPFGCVTVVKDLGGIYDTSPFDYRLSGMVMEEGSPLSHTAISLKKAEVPTALKVKNAMEELGDASLVVVDSEGSVIKSPTPETLSRVIRQIADSRRQAARERNIHLPAAIENGPTIQLMANITRAEDLVTKFIGSARYRDNTYSFHSSDLINHVNREERNGTVKKICTLKSNEAVPNWVSGEDREFVEWVRKIRVDNEGEARQAARNMGIEILTWKRHTGAVGMGAEGVGLIRTEHMIDVMLDEFKRLRINFGGGKAPELMERWFHHEFCEMIDAYKTEWERNTQKLSAVHLKPEESEYIRSNIAKPLVFRAPDWGRDKPLPDELVGMVVGYDENECRAGHWDGGIDFDLKNKDLLLKPVLKAAMRASHDKGHDMHLMLPMVISPLDVTETLTVMDESSSELSGTPHKEKLFLVPLLEKPESAVSTTLERIIEQGKVRGEQRITSLCVGMNDFTAFATGAPRNLILAKAIDGTVLRPMTDIISIANRHELPVGVCGESAGDVVNARVYARLGIDYLSMSGTSIPEVKNGLRRTNMERLPEPEEILDRALKDPDSLRRDLERRE